MPPRARRRPEAGILKCRPVLAGQGTSIRQGATHECRSAALPRRPCDFPDIGAKADAAAGLDLGSASACFPTPACVSAPRPREFFIQGITLAGKTFRPGDWTERLAGALSSFRPKSGAGGIGAQIGYSPYGVPRVIDGIKCVIVSEALRDIEPMAWDFVVHFARDNELQVVEAGLLPDPPAP